MSHSEQMHRLRVRGAAGKQGVHELLCMPAQGTFANVASNPDQLAWLSVATDTVECAVVWSTLDARGHRADVKRFCVMCRARADAGRV